jgi:RNA polymerase sigma factor (TIGR02999 family)
MLSGASLEPARTVLVPRRERLPSRVVTCAKVTNPGDVTQYLNRWSDGDEAAQGPLFDLIYPELRRIAGALTWNQRSPVGLQSTALVNEFYLKFVQQHSLRFEDRVHFYSLAARFMRRILVDAARHSGRQKRDGAAAVPLHPDIAWLDAQSVEMLDLDRALEELRHIDERKCRMLELRFFLGLTAAETAEFLSVGKATIDRDYSFTVGWLNQRLRTLQR